MCPQEGEQHLFHSLYVPGIRDIFSINNPSCLNVMDSVQDVDLLPGGDLALVGDRGANLSGGQKARVSLARCAEEQTQKHFLDSSLL